MKISFGEYLSPYKIYETEPHVDNHQNATLALALSLGSSLVRAEEGKLTATVVWTTYGTSTATYSEAIAIGSILKNKEGANLRLRPGKNDVSRLAPVRTGKAQFSSTGADAAAEHRQRLHSHFFDRR